MNVYKVNFYNELPSVMNMVEYSYLNVQRKLSEFGESSALHSIVTLTDSNSFDLSRTSRNIGKSLLGQILYLLGNS